MTTISLELPDELARRLAPLQNRLPEIIKLGLRQLEVESQEKAETNRAIPKKRILAALSSTGIVTIPGPVASSQARIRRTPIKAGGPPASEMIISQRREKL